MYKWLKKQKAPKLPKLSKQEIQKRIDEWKASPLSDISHLTTDRSFFPITPIGTSDSIIIQSRCIGEPTPQLIVSLPPVESSTPVSPTPPMKVVDFCSSDYLNMSRDSKLIDMSRKVIEKYGVGSCGPRGFYGTMTSHLRLEEAFSKFLGTDASICYALGYATSASVIPAFSKQSDIIIADNNCSMGLKSGIRLSRSFVVWCDMWDLEDLQRGLNEAEIMFKKLEKKNSRSVIPQWIRQSMNFQPSTRKFIVFDSISPKSGKVCNFPILHEIAEKYGYRMCMDETESIGVLGKHGKGVTEYWTERLLDEWEQARKREKRDESEPRRRGEVEKEKVSPLPPSGYTSRDVSFTTLALSSSFGSVGGICVGSHEVIEHQRLNGLGYVFSASAPPFLAEVPAQVAEDLSAGKCEAQLKRLQHNISVLRDTIMHQEHAEGNNLHVRSDRMSPCVHVSIDVGVSQCSCDSDSPHALCSVCKTHIINMIWRKMLLKGYCIDRNFPVNAPSIPVEGEKEEEGVSVSIRVSSEHSLAQLKGVVRELQSVSESIRSDVSSGAGVGRAE
ncbi:hypothetical protein ADUPG1_008045 [Aduncisulcus paluster]|uniref:serine C-palmitoyltransferase n=1 Tax=Aduncisulcus paluster TaxID=2918883 RepID=A0ABQ5KUP6_9EUKA|nr:hypothetical protein ADUPG1_008045 [Aduncisulcus paluster]